MALGFFRSHQKMVIIIMVVLMVSFLIGGQTLNWFTGSHGGGDAEIGTVKVPAGGKLTSQDLAIAQSELGILKAIFGPGDLAGLLEMLNPKRPTFAFALLLKDAQAHGVTAGEMDVDAALAQADTPPSPYATGEGSKVQLSAIKARLNGQVGDSAIRQAVADREMIFKHAQMSLPTGPVSRETARLYFRDASERIALAIVKVPADHFLDKLPQKEPTSKEIQDFFNEYRNQQAETYPFVDSFGFGYRVPAQVNVNWMQLNPQAIEAVSRPTAEAITTYLSEHPDDLFTEVMPPADAVNQTPIKKPMTEAEKTARAVEVLTPDTAHARLTDLDAAIRKKLSQHEGAAGPAYPAVAESFRLGAAAYLARKPGVAVVQETVADALRMLSDATKVEIAFPIGQQGKFNIDPKLLVSVASAAQGTLGEALAELAKTVGLPEMNYFACEGIKDAIFAVGDEVSLFPIRQGETGLVSPKALLADPAIGKAMVNQRASLALAAFQVEPLVKSDADEESERDTLKLGLEGPVAYVVTEQMEFYPVLWRVVAAEPAKAPETITDEIRTQIIADWRTAQAFKMAQEELSKSVTSAEGMRVYAKEAKIDLAETGLISRLLTRPADEQGSRLVFQPNMPAETGLPRGAMLSQSDAGLPGPQLAFFFEKAFALAPENIDAPSPRKGTAVAIIPLPAARAVLMAQRIDYVPAQRAQFERAEGLIVGSLTMERNARMQRQWFSFDDIARRVGYERRR